MKNPSAFILILFSLLGVAVGHAQEIYLKTCLGLMAPLRRSFVGVELGRKIAPEYSIGLAGEVSATESNVSPMITYSYKSLSLGAGMGWGHRWQHEGCNDHNFHTYTLGVYWKKPIRQRCSLYVGCAGIWRSYQAHIGLHRGAMMISAGLEFEFNRSKKNDREQKRQ